DGCGAKSGIRESCRSASVDIRSLIVHPPIQASLEDLSEDAERRLLLIGQASGPDDPSFFASQEFPDQPGLPQAGSPYHGDDAAFAVIGHVALLLERVEFERSAGKRRPLVSFCSMRTRAGHLEDLDFVGLALDLDSPLRLEEPAPP